MHTECSYSTGVCIVATDSFKACLTAAEVSDAVLKGLDAAGFSGMTVSVPMSDGGEGFGDLLASYFDAEWVPVEVSDPLGRPVRAGYHLCSDGLAIIESASALGLALVEPELRDPMHESSEGLGMLIDAAVSNGASRLIIGLGGTATCDGGAGLRRVCNSLHIPVTAACDTRAIYHEAVTMYGIQKGLAPESFDDAIAMLDANAREMDEAGGVPEVWERPSSGAAGGIGGCLMSMGAKVVSGAELMLDICGLKDSIRAALDSGLSPVNVITGEGRFDEQSLTGKLPSAVLDIVRQLRAEVPGSDIRLVIIAGAIADNMESDEYELLCITPPGMPAEVATKADVATDNITAAVSRMLFAKKFANPQK